MVVGKCVHIRLSPEEAKDLLYFTKWADITERTEEINISYVDTVQELYRELRRLCV